MRTVFKQILVVAVCLTVVWFAGDAFAQRQQPTVNLTVDKVIETLTRLVCWFARLSGTLMVGAIIFYGIRIMMAGGDPTKLAEAKKALGWALVGLIVILGAYVIIATVANAVGSDVSIVPISC